MTHHDPAVKLQTALRGSEQGKGLKYGVGMITKLLIYNKENEEL